MASRVNRLGVSRYEGAWDRDFPAADRAIGLAETPARMAMLEAPSAALGMEFAGEPVDFGASSAIYGRDPFGNVIELYEIRDPAIAQLGHPMTLRPSA